jgi:GT2 family glycosyltransferase
MTTTTARPAEPGPVPAGAQRAVVVIPTYNEADSLPRLLDDLAAVRGELPSGVVLDVLVVDDGSPDGTADLVRLHPAYGSWLGLLARGGKAGLGDAYRAGFSWALDAGYDLVLQMDADGSHPATALPAMLAGLMENDLVIGSRYVRGGRTENWPLRRRLLSAGANHYARSMLWLRTRDATAGFRGWRADAIHAAGVLHSDADGYGFQVENTWRAERSGLRVAEQPITFVERVAGASKMSPGVAGEAVALIARWRVAEIAAWLRRHLLVAGLVVLAGLLRVPFLHRPLTSDEAGFLTVAAQWHHGTSLYGDYWVDRPPLLILLFRMAALAGGEVPLRLLGTVATMVAVALAGLLGGLVTSRRIGPVLTAATALLLLDAPLFGGQIVNGELLAVPFVFAGLCCIVRASRPDTALRWWAAAGAAGMAAGLVKQSLLDVFAVAAALLVWELLRRSRRDAASQGAAFVGGALVVLAAVLGIAWLYGTQPAGIWDAVVTFRMQAADVISSQASPHTAHRARVLAVAWVWSGAPLLLLVSLLRRTPRAPSPHMPLGWLAVTLLVWEAFGVAAGGSYWLHYLIGTVPGTVFVLARAIAVGIPVRRCVVALAVVALSLAMTTNTVLHRAPRQPAGVRQVSTWLRAHDRPGQTGIVAYGQSEILRTAGLRSPYTELWSLPVRVRDPRLQELTEVLAGPRPPTWIITGEHGLASWGINPSLARPVLAARYTQVERIGTWRILRLRQDPPTGYIKD